MFRVLPHKPVQQQIRLLHVTKSCCRKWRVVIPFATECVHVARFTGPRQTCFPISDVTPVHGALPRKFIQSEVRIHATCKSGLNLGGKRRN